ncbi:DUF7344 domain-containing protein [Natrinema marinum]|uniref:DUF7344 domain-containing protein n=1 Tax=Natrinema marinum TaxID=2961598 RepID=UPI0020C87779|nr:hypothetical protein [Natrinema marinum]
MIGRSHTDAVDGPTRTPDAEALSSDLDLDDIYHLLQTRRRRDVLRYLREAEEPVRLRELAEQIAAWEQDTTVENLQSDERQRVYISLYQSHLPKLDNHGIVDYDKDRGRVAATPLANQFDQYLRPPGETESADRWPLWYAGTAGLGGLLLAVIAMGIVPISGLTGGAIILVAFAVVTGIHAWSTGHVQ